MYNALLTCPGDPGTGPSRLINLCDTPTLMDLNFENLAHFENLVQTLNKKVTSHSNSANSVEEQQVSTLVCHTCMWDPPKTGTYRAATGPKKKCLTLPNIFKVFWSKVKSRPALPNRANPLASTLGNVGVCHARPQGPGRARDGPVSDLLPSRSRFY